MALRKTGAFAVSTLLLSSLALVALANVPIAMASSTPQIVQFSSGYTSGGSDTSVSLTFQNPVAKGDTIVLCTTIASGNGIKITSDKPTDSLTTVYHGLQLTRTDHYQYDSYARAWFGVATTSGSAAVHLSYVSGPAAIFGYEISGAGTVSSGSFISSSGHGRTSASPSVTAYSPNADSLVIACGSFANPTGTVSNISAGTGYTLDQQFVSDFAAQHLSGFSGTSTTSPFSLGLNAPRWSEVSVSISGA
ncbi:MAG TPA: hypothetical protein VEB67_01065 [Nitrososphaerales archaeon]|nr:hypothetical protein [Nitrososphaerales archaeon]